jgi:hypothetical protein
LNDKTGLFDRARTLASVIHADEVTAHSVARHALAALPGAVSAQDKRLYYSGTRSTKVWLDRDTLLQQLVFAASDRAERADESRREVGDRDLLIRFVKHLVWISSRRNSFYVSIAVARMLYGFSATETAELYTRLIDAEGAKDEAYCRARKRVLVSELNRRFPSANLTRATAESRATVTRCLEAFTPWGTTCDGDPTDEMQCMHALLHPPCFRATVTELGWPDPHPRLLVPRFATAGMPFPGEELMAS